MRLQDFFKPEAALLRLAEDISVSGALSAPNADKFMSKLEDLFKIRAKDPQHAVRVVIHMLLDKPSRTTRMYMNNVLTGATKAGIRIEPGLRQSAERFLDEGKIEHAQLVEAIDVSGVCELNGVTYDQISGVGACPYNANIETFGRAVLMKPSNFLSLALPLTGHEQTSEVSSAISEGKAIGSPYLTIKFGADHRPDGAKIISHEGRHRALAIMEQYGDVDMLVHLIFLGSRPKNISSVVLDKINQGMISEDGIFKTGPFWIAV